MENLGPGDPQRIGVYRLLARLGAGGMGQVYLARSDRGRTVAVKLVREELAAREEFRARFRQEVQAAQRVGGYWTAPVLDADTEADVPWVATGYVAGPSLQQVVGRDHGALPERSVRILAAGLAHALKDIHAAGIVHRDLKPSNVLVTIDGPRVIDFGIARALETVTEGGLTSTGALVGSPGFMAPEQVRGDRITPACDIFCLGSILAFAATGHLPFGGADSGVHALMFRIAQEEPDLDDLPEGIADLVRDCLKKEPGARPTLDRILERTGAEDTVSGGRSHDPWLPGSLVAQLGRHAVQLLDTEDPEGPGASAGPPPEAPPEHAPAAADGPPPAGPPQPGAPGAGGQNHLPTMVAGVGAGTVGPPTNTPPHPAYGGPGTTPAAQGHPQQLGPGQGGQGGHGGQGGQGGGHGPGVQGHPQQPYPPQAYPPQSYPPQAPGPGGQPPGYGHPQPGGQPPGYGYPQQPAPWNSPGAPGSPYHPYGSTPPYGPPVVPLHGGGPDEPRRRSSRGSAALVAVALVVALGAGGSVYALMSGGDDDTQSDDRPGPTPTVVTSDGPTEPQPSTPPPSTPGASTPAGGAIPTGYLGTWTTTIDNADGANTRQLTIQQGEVGDTVLSLVADGPSGSGTYHCVFEADLTGEPGASGPLRIGPSTVTTGRPMSSCSPGEATEITLLPDGRLRRVNTASGEELTYSKQ
ncbi:serine/threonine-protein kinase [Streptomyces sp. NPDC088387]|uniref:serine/threonine-protein kinase n=1 Tax=Streptomyces sp. NPDC088387 TaxID=3365859 RepID=UPI00380B9097